MNTFMQVFTQMPRSWRTFFRKSSIKCAGGNNERGIFNTAQAGAEIGFENFDSIVPKNNERTVSYPFNTAI